MVALLEHEEVKAVLSILDKQDETFQGIHDQIVGKMNLCSTSTLYRRIKELELAGIILREKNLILTEFGRNMFHQTERKDNDLEVKLKHYRYLSVIDQYPYESTTDLISQTQSSPNELIRIMKSLEEKGYIRILKRNIGKGRPKKVYELTEKGKRVKKEITKLLKEGERK